MLKEAKWDTKRFKKNGTDVDIYEWNVDRFFDGMWDKLYSALTEGADDSVDASKHYKKMYHFDDVSGAPLKWERPGFDSICVYQKDKDNLKFVEYLARKYHLDFAYKFDKNILDTPNAVVIYVPANATVDEYIQYEPESYRKSTSAKQSAKLTADIDDDVDESLAWIARAE